MKTFQVILFYSSPRFTLKHPDFSIPLNPPTHPAYYQQSMKILSHSQKSNLIIIFSALTAFSPERRWRQHFPFLMRYHSHHHLLSFSSILIRKMQLNACHESDERVCAPQSVDNCINSHDGGDTYDDDHNMMTIIIW